MGHPLVLPDPGGGEGGQAAGRGRTGEGGRAAMRARRGEAIGQWVTPDTENTPAIHQAEGDPSLNTV
ncbi:hypothetical protein ACWDOR_22010 [Streptosporangium canum]|uniref:hypothetical protein n=1 Tax=Streptosporangium canum TaxID=324952 RepID=UPI00367E2A6D